MRPELQVFGQCRSRDLGLHRATGKKGWPVPFRTTLGVGVHPAGDHTTACFPCFRPFIIAVSLDGLTCFDIDLALVLIGEIFPAAAPAIGG